MDEQHGAPRASGEAAEVIDQPDPLLSKVGVVAEGAPDPIAMADKAVEEQGKFYLDRSRDDLASLRAVFERGMGDCADRSDALRSMFALAHNMRGQGGSFGYHMVTDIASSLCDLLRDRTDLTDAAMKIVKLHIDALGIVFEHDLKGDGGAQGRKLLERLSGLAAGRAG